MSRRWIPVALSGALRRGGVLRTFVHGRECAVWRSASGAVHAWDNRCPHRGMRLSHGFVRGEVLACLYHGWHYGSDGVCSRIPAHPDLTPPRSICVPSETCLEAGGFVWAGGDPATPPEDVPRRAVRSLHVETPLPRLRDALAAGGWAEATGGLLSSPTGPGWPAPATAALQHWDAATTVVHLAAPEGTDLPDLTALSRAAEALRAAVEETAA